MLKIATSTHTAVDLSTIRDHYTIQEVTDLCDAIDFRNVVDAQASKARS